MLYIKKIIKNKYNKMENEDLSYINIIYDINKKMKMKIKFIYLDMIMLRII